MNIPEVSILQDNLLILKKSYKSSYSLAPGIDVVVDLPEGTVYDGATVNAAFWSVIGHPMQAEFLEAALIHDQICTFAKTTNVRRLGDALFNLILERNKVPRWKRVSMFLVVRLYALLVWPFKRNNYR